MYRYLTLALLAVGSTLSFAQVPQVWQAPFFNGIAAQVEESLITYDDIRREMAPLVGTVRAQASGDADFDARMSALYLQILRTQVQRALLVAEFASREYMVPPKAIDEEFRRILQDNFEGRLSQLVDALQAQGLTLTDYRRKLGQNMAAESLSGRFRAELPPVTPQQIEAYYQAHTSQFATSATVNLAVITLRPLADEPTEVVLQNAQQLHTQLVSSADPAALFSDLARQYNTDSTNTWGWTSLSDLAPQVMQAVRDLPAGAIATPVSLDSGAVLLIRVLDRRDQGVRPLAEVSEDIRRQLTQTQGNAAFNAWMAQLQAKFYVRLSDGLSL